MNPQQREIDIKHILQKVDLGMAKIAPLVTKNLIEEFEKTGISPVFSKDGHITGLKLVKVGVETNLIHISEWEDINNSIKSSDHSLDNFWFLEYDQTQCQSNKIYSIAARLLVVSKQSGKLKEYQVGNGSTFPSDLIADIKNNFFQ